YLLVFYALVSFLTSFFLFFFPSSLAPPVLHSFPTRRSSDLFVWRICGASAQKPPQRNKLTRLADQIARTVATFLYVPIPTANNKDRKSTRLNSSHDQISYAVFCLKKKKKKKQKKTIN